MPQLRIGELIWLRCEVKPGPFPNERFVRITLPSGSWVGFVDTTALKNPTVEEGSTCVLARITQVKENDVIALVQGHALDTRQVQESTDQVEPFVPVSS